LSHGGGDESSRSTAIMAASSRVLARVSEVP